MFNCIAKFAYISVPRPALQLVYRVLCERQRTVAGLGCETGRQQRNVSHSFPQRRDRNLERTDAKKQVVTEASCRDAGLEIPVGRCDYAKRSLHGLIATDRQDFTLLKRSQQFHLQRQRDVGDFVEK